MNLFSGSTLASTMRPMFWKRMNLGPTGFWANYEREQFFCK